MLRRPLPTHHRPIVRGVTHFGEGVGICREVLGVASLMSNILRDITHLPWES